MTAESPSTCSPSRSTISRSTPCVDGWFGPKLMRMMSALSTFDGSSCFTVGIGCGMREPSYWPSCTIGHAVRVGAIVTAWVSLGFREADGLAALRVVLAQRVALPVVVHDQPREVGMAVEADPHQVELLALEPVRRRPDADDRGHGLAVVRPHLEAHARGRPAQREQVVRDREALRLHLGHHLQSLRHREVDVASARGADVARDAATPPEQIVRRDDVREHLEAELVARVLAGLADALALDRDRRLAERFAFLDEAGNRVVPHVATSRRSYAGGTPARCASCKRMIPSINASGRGGQNGT